MTDFKHRKKNCQTVTCVFHIPSGISPQGQILSFPQMFKKCDRLGYTALVPPTGSCGCSLRVWVGVGILWESLHYKLAIEMNVSANVSISGRVMEKAVEEEWMNVQTTKCFKEEIILKETGLFECKKTKKRNHKKRLLTCRNMAVSLPPEQTPGHPVTEQWHLRRKHLDLTRTGLKSVRNETVERFSCIFMFHTHLYVDFGTGTA